MKYSEYPNGKPVLKKGAMKYPPSILAKVHFRETGFRVSMRRLRREKARLRRER